MGAQPLSDKLVAFKAPVINRESPKTNTAQAIPGELRAWLPPYVVQYSSCTRSGARSRAILAVFGSFGAFLQLSLGPASRQRKPQNNSRLQDLKIHSDLHHC